MNHAEQQVKLALTSQRWDELQGEAACHFCCDATEQSPCEGALCIPACATHSGGWGGV